MEQRSRIIKNGGMSIIELLMICSLVFIVISLVIVAMNPVGSSAAARNAARWNAVNELGNALYRARGDGKFTTPESPNKAYGICGAKEPAEECGARGGLSLSPLVPEYLGSVPTDPLKTEGGETGYTVLFGANGRIEISAPLSEAGDRITTTR